MLGLLRWTSRFWYPIRAVKRLRLRRFAVILEVSLPNPGIKRTLMVRTLL